MGTENKFPPELIDLPSSGWYYDVDNPLSSGQLELKYMTAKEEDILTSRNLIQKGIVFDRLLQSLIVNKDIDYNSLLTADRNGIMIASRILAYGKDYRVKVRCRDCGTMTDTSVDLTQLEEKTLKEPEEKGVNSFTFELPFSKTTVTFKLLTQGDQNSIDHELRQHQKTGSDIDTSLSTRLKYIITAVDGDDNKQIVRAFVDNSFVTRDSRAFREYYSSVNPDIDLEFSFQCESCNEERRATMPIGIEFFWPEF